jgi:hypothetical protein
MLIHAENYIFHVFTPCALKLRVLRVLRGNKNVFIRVIRG